MKVMFLLYATLLVSALADPTKPVLSLDFSATAVEEAHGSTVTKKFALSSSKFMIATDSVQQPFNKDITQVIDCEQMKELMIEPYFNSTICYKMPLNVPGGMSKKECFDGSAGQLVPVAAYKDAKYIGEVPGYQIWGQMSHAHREVPMYENGKKYVIKVDSYSKVEFYVSAAGLLNKVFQNSTEVISGKPGMTPGQQERTENVSTLTYTNVKSPAPESAFAPKNVKCVPIGEPRPSVSDGYVNDERLLKSLAQEDLLWEAGPTDYMAGMPYDQVSARLGTHIRPLRLKLRETKPEELLADIPTSFDSRKQWPKCDSIGHIRNQGNCGSCWAFGATESLEDRFCIHSGGKSKPWLSPEYLTDCDKHDGGCGGGFLDNAWEFLVSTGIPDNTCDPYQHCAYPPFPNCTKPRSHIDELEEIAISRKLLQMPGNCPSKCADNEPLKRYTAKTAYAVAPPGDVAGMQREILKNGPIEVAFFVFSDFMQYKGGIYKKSKTAQGPLGGHAVKILGWGVGTDAGKTPYWIVANSWSPNWGDKGYFMIVQGTNECGIETTPAAGLPNLSTDGFPNLS